MDTFEFLLDGLLLMVQQQGSGGNVVKDGYDQLSPPEVATWTGKWHQLALCRSGREVWLEPRQFLNNPGDYRIVATSARVTDPEQFTSTFILFAIKES